MQTENNVVNQENTRVDDTLEAEIMETGMETEHEIAGVDHDDTIRMEYVDENNISTQNEESERTIT